MQPNRETFALIDSLYEVAMRGEDWQTLASRFAQAFDAQSSFIQYRNALTGQVVRLSETGNFTPSVTRAYVDHHYRYDDWIKGGILHHDKPVIGNELIRHDKFVESQFYNECCRPLGMIDLLGSVLFLNGSQEIGAIGIHREKRERFFVSEEKERLGLVLPHLRRALHIRSHFADSELQKTALLEALNGLSVGIFIVDRQCEIVFANDIAGRLLRQGSAITANKKKLRAVKLDQNIALEILVRSYADCSGIPASDYNGRLSSDREILARGEGLTLVGRSGRTLTMLVCPMRQELVSGLPPRPLAMIVVADPSSKAPILTSTLSSLYALTGAEARLAVALLNDERLSEYAERTGISINTARTQLRQIFQKTGTSRQSEFVKHVLSNPIASMAGRMNHLESN